MSDQAARATETATIEGAKHPSTGSLAYGFHEASRTEHMLRFALGAFGTAVPIPREEDCGYDMLCGLGERVGRRLYVREHYYVQVKSRKEDLVYPDPESVRWLVSLACPLFIAVADKASGVIEVFQTVEVPSLGENVKQVRLTFTDGPQFNGGKQDPSVTEATLHLGQPILRFSLSEVGDPTVRDRLAGALGFWVQHGREHIEERRAGRLVFSYPATYEPNETPAGKWVVNGTFRLGPRQWDVLHDRMLKCFGVMLLASANYSPGRFDQFVRICGELFDGLTSSDSWGLRFFTGSIDMACRRLNRPNPWSARSSLRDIREVVILDSVRCGWTKPPPGEPTTSTPTPVG